MTTNSTDRYQVTEAQLDKCHRVIDLNTVPASVFYKVESQTTEGETYTVRYLKDKGGLSCTCKGTANGYICWHKRAAVLHSRLYQAELAERKAQSEAAERQAEDEHEAHIERLMSLGLNREQAEQAVNSQSEQDDETLARVYGAKPKQPIRKGDLYSNQGFSLMR